MSIVRYWLKGDS